MNFKLIFGNNILYKSFRIYKICILSMDGLLPHLPSGEQCVYAIEISLVHFVSKSYQDERCVFTIYPIGCDFQNP